MKLAVHQKLRNRCFNLVYTWRVQCQGGTSSPLTDLAFTIHISVIASISRVPSSTPPYQRYRGVSPGAFAITSFRGGHAGEVYASPSHCQQELENVRLLLLSLSRAFSPNVGAVFFSSDSLRRVLMDVQTDVKELRLRRVLLLKA